MNIYSHKYHTLRHKKIQDVIAKRCTAVTAAHDLCVSRQTIYRWIHRYKRFGVDGLMASARTCGSGGHNKTPAQIEEQVIVLAEQYYADGVQSLADQLEVQGISLHPTTIYRILKRTGVRYGQRWSHTQRYKRKKLYAHKEAGYELQVDTKYPFGYKVGVVAYTAVDDASRWSYCRMYTTANAANTQDFIAHLQQMAPFAIQKVRTDCGTEFTATAVRAYLAACNITHRTNTPYCPEDNGKIERFHRTLNEKAISLYWSPHDTLETLQYKLTLFLQWYNHIKKHRGLGMHGMTPYEKLTHLAAYGVTPTLQCNNTLQYTIALLEY